MKLLQDRDEQSHTVLKQCQDGLQQQVRYKFVMYWIRDSLLGSCLCSQQLKDVDLENTNHQLQRQLQSLQDQHAVIREQYDAAQLTIRQQVSHLPSSFLTF